MSKLSPKQKRFCEEYIKDSNATQACIRAGYSKRTAHSQGPRLLEKVGVSDYLSILSEPNKKKAQLTQAQHLDKLEELRDMAVEAGNVQAAIRAEELRGKCTGQYIERKADVDTDGNDVPREISVKFVGVEDE